MPQNDESKWHLDKRVPLALIVTIIVQTGAIVWWGATTSARLDALERKMILVEPQTERLVRVEERLIATQQGIADIKADLKQLIRPAIPAR